MVPSIQKTLKNFSRMDEEIPFGETKEKMAQLLMVKGEDAGAIYTLDHFTLVGSGKTCHIQLPPSLFPEELLRFRKSKKNYYLEVLEKDIPIFLNEKPFKKGVIQHGDLLQMGETLFLFNDEGPLDLVKAEENSSHIQKRQAYYDSDERILASFENKNKDRETTRLHTLYKIQTILTKNLDLVPLMSEILEVIFEEFQPRQGFILLYHSESQSLSPLVQKGYSEGPLYSSTILKEVLSKQESILSYNAQEDERFRSGKSVVDAGLTCTLCAPIIFHKKILGILQIETGVSGIYSEEDLDQISKIATLTALALEATQNRYKNQKFIQSLIQLSEGSEELFSVLELPLLYQKAIQFAQTLFEYPVNLFFSLQEQNFRLVASSGLPSPVPSLSISVHHPFFHKISPKTEQHLLPISLNDFSGLASCFSQEMEGWILPLQRPNSFSEFLLFAQELKGFEESNSFHKELSSLLAKQISVALQNARFHQDILKKNEEIAYWNLELEKRVESRTKALKQTEKELQEAEKMATIGRLASGVSHEFNNMLTSMYGFAQMAKRNEEYQERLVDMVLKQTKRGREVTSSLLELARDPSTLQEPLDFVLILEELLKHFQASLQKSQIHLNWQLPS
jgi:hypothetical protein